MVQITEEERSVVVEGYVFDMEVRTFVFTYEEGAVNFLAGHVGSGNVYKRQALGPIESTYHRLGFPKFSVHTMIDVIPRSMVVN
ncbi:hypothetical protein WP50_10505 [Lactiplantibacillus plantarum]|nr:hypothetical protein WP50_10505 [Lactiplantibacillus plantarum]